MTIAFLSDLHLPYHGDAVQYKVLRWALTQAAEAERKKQIPNKK